MCTDSGAYMANLISCASCKGNQLKAVNQTYVEESDVETTTYDRKIDFLVVLFPSRHINILYYEITDICGSCQHLISSHHHKFWIDGDYQEYTMECMLCGVAEDSISIMPDDPRKLSGLLL